MRFLYIGMNNLGSTSGMRAKALQQILKPGDFKIIDTSIPFFETLRLFRSIGFRYKFGPFITKLNKFILTSITEELYDLIWIDKASFISPTTAHIIKQKAGKLVHFTPDTAFFQNRSRLFERSLPYYDYFITTKSFDLDRYPIEKTILISQGFDTAIHKSHHSFEEKTREVVFVGLFEPYRGEVIQLLLEAGIRVTVAGKKWNKFNHLQHPLFEYLGDELLGESYAQVISSSLFGLGLLSKRFPELHTTRTFEIPACGTALITERNKETAKFFEEGEVIFYKLPEELPPLINYYKLNKLSLKNMTLKTQAKIVTSGFDYYSILQNALFKIWN